MGTSPVRESQQSQGKLYPPQVRALRESVNEDVLTILFLFIQSTVKYPIYARVMFLPPPFFLFLFGLVSC